MEVSNERLRTNAPFGAYACCLAKSTRFCASYNRPEHSERFSQYSERPPESEGY